MADTKPPLLLWLDVETTGLDPNKDLLLEVAWRVTNLDGSDVDFIPSTSDHGSHLIYYGPNYVDRSIKDPVVLDMHRKSRLLDELDKLSPIPDPMYPQKTPVFVDHLLHESLSPWANNHTLHPAGKSVWFDMEFLRRYLPKSAHVAETIQLEGRTARRFFDVAALKLVGDLLGAPWVEVPFVGTKHRAMDDVNHDVACWRATLRALEGRKIVRRALEGRKIASEAGPKAVQKTTTLPSAADLVRRFADMESAWANGREARIQGLVDSAVRGFVESLGRYFRSPTGPIEVSCGRRLDPESDAEGEEARKRLAELFKQHGYHTILKTTHVEIRLS